jgi:hypothetical protein
MGACGLPCGRSLTHRPSNPVLFTNPQATHPFTGASPPRRHAVAGGVRPCARFQPEATDSPRPWEREHTLRRYASASRCQRWRSKRARSQECAGSRPGRLPLCTCSPVLQPRAEPSRIGNREPRAGKWSLLRRADPCRPGCESTRRAVLATLARLHVEISRALLFPVESRRPAKQRSDEHAASPFNPGASSRPR